MPMILPLCSPSLHISGCCRHIGSPPILTPCPASRSSSPLALSFPPIFLTTVSTLAPPIPAVEAAPLHHPSTRALIRFKSTITHDPYSCLSSWSTATTASNPAATPAATGDAADRPIHCSSGSRPGWYNGVLRCDARFHASTSPIAGLSGSISPSLALLSSLRVLNLSPSLFPRPHSSLQHLDLSAHICLLGDIPQSLVLNLPNLRVLRLLYMSLDGTIPPAMWTHLPVLEQLVITPHELLYLSIPATSFPPTTIDGAIAHFRFCSTIKVLRLDGPHVVGHESGAPFPSSLGDCHQLQILVLSVRGLQGSIPSSIWKLPRLRELVIKDLDLEEIDLGLENQAYSQRPYKLHGALGNFCCTTGSTISELTLAGISLTGNIPASIGASCGASLQTLSLTDVGGLEGPIPSSLGDCHGLIALELSVTGLSGSIPASIWELPRLQTLVIEELDLLLYSGPYTEPYGQPYNRRPYKLRGSLPPTLGFCSGVAGSTISEITLVGIDLRGREIPTSIGACGASLRTLQLSHTGLEGLIPSTIGNLSNLQYLYLQNNNLTGGIPPQLGALTNLLDLDLSANTMTGEIPSTLGALKNVQYLDLSRNSLTGEIPPTLGAQTQLQILDLSGNSLSGEIPGTVGALTMLTVLDLSANRLTGGIPSSIVL